MRNRGIRGLINTLEKLKKDGMREDGKRSMKSSDVLTPLGDYGRFLYLVTLRNIS